ncbi:enoyl-CoA hydratase/isomerase family protein [Acetobacterium malicum]|uniref:enoyl-CoA hydratase/isomerase family protein n=1 Tax=Acetobacterium malicum TaxID=52692 RepID=UPI0003F87BF8|nr:enoyl-CoA hydratase-related protein [Acetobacterium dehalogenans]
MEFKKIEYSVKNYVAKVVLNSPKNLNALDESMLDELLLALELIENDDEVKVAVLAGSGNGFSAGGDIKYMYSTLKSGEMEFGDAVKKAGLVAYGIKRLSKPVIAAVHGAVAGAGVNVALACDFCFATEETQFIQAFVKLGLVPDAGGIYLLTRAVGVNKAIELVMTGRPVGADEALTIGMINKVVSADKLEETVYKTAEQLLMSPSIALAGMKALIFESEYKGFQEYLTLEEQLQNKCGATEDFREGVFAFVEKRKANFIGK